ncbi:MAG: hypothetical protein R2708_19130 [Vicinamibacterales bacterium]
MCHELTQHGRQAGVVHRFDEVAGAEVVGLGLQGGVARTGDEARGARMFDLRDGHKVQPVVVAEMDVGHDRLGLGLGQKLAGLEEASGGHDREPGIGQGGETVPAVVDTDEQHGQAGFLGGHARH